MRLQSLPYDSGLRLVLTNYRHQISPQINDDTTIHSIQKRIDEIMIPGFQTFYWDSNKKEYSNKSGKLAAWYRFIGDVFNKPDIYKKGLVETSTIQAPPVFRYKLEWKTIGVNTPIHLDPYHHNNDLFPSIDLHYRVAYNPIQDILYVLEQ